MKRGSRTHGQPHRPAKSVASHTTSGSLVPRSLGPLHVPIPFVCSITERIGHLRRTNGPFRTAASRPTFACSIWRGGCRSTRCRSRKPTSGHRAHELGCCWLLCNPRRRIAISRHQSPRTPCRGNQRRYLYISIRFDMKGYDSGTSFACLRIASYSLTFRTVR